MNKTQALSRIAKRLGKNAGIHDRRLSSSPEQRAADRAARQAANERKRASDAAATARRTEVLAADAEYQRLNNEYLSARAEVERIPINHYRYCAGVNNSLFFSVKAEADTLDELVAKVCEKESP